MPSCICYQLERSGDQENCVHMVKFSFSLGLSADVRVVCLESSQTRVGTNPSQSRRKRVYGAELRKRIEELHTHDVYTCIYVYTSI